MDHPQVSVVMAVRNAEDTLKESLASVLGQTFANFEFIIIDDGSSDRTGDILQQAAAQDSRVKVFTQGQRGLTNSLTRAISVAQGRYLARQDGDDLSMPERF